MPAHKKAEQAEGQEPEAEQAEGGKVLGFTVYVGDDVYPAGTAETPGLREQITAEHVWVDGE